MQKKFVIILMMSLLTCACYSSYPSGEKLTNKIFYKVMKEKLIPTNHYVLIGYGGHFDREIVVRVSPNFYYNKDCSQEQMEDALINTTEALLEAYNSNKKIRPLLVDYPMTQKNFRVIISANWATLDSPNNINSISFTSQSPWLLYYCHRDPITGRPTIRHDEYGDPYDVVKARRAAAHAAHANAAADLSTTSVDHPKGAGSS